MEYGSNVSDDKETYGTTDMGSTKNKTRKMSDLFIQPPFPPANHPSRSNDLKKRGNERYKTGGVEPIDLITDGGMLWHFALGNIIKYAFRLRGSREVIKEDLEKIIHYAEILLATLK